jgi:cyclic pyranopterin monophosphate synthase
MAKCTVVAPSGTAAALEAAGEGIDVVEAARVAGMLAAKHMASLISLCHPIRISGVRVDVAVESHHFEVRAVTEIVERTGVEMDALTACAVAALTLVQALLHIDPTASVEDLTLRHKSGGRSGDWQRTGPGNRMTHREASGDSPTPDHRT